MKFQVHSSLEYQVFGPSTFIFNIHALRTTAQSILEESLTVDPYLRVEEFTSHDGSNRFARLVVEDNITFRIDYRATVDMEYQVVNVPELEEVPVVQLSAEVIPFLFPSRYCQSDKLQRLAFNQFGGIGNTFDTVQAITNWIYDNVAYLSGTSNSQTSAYDTVTERAGVCRDFAHLGIAFCRALSIPARYFTGYAFKLKPQDFHACFEAYIGGHWLIFDATKLAPRNGLVKIATGRDAADAALATIFGQVYCNRIQVSCELLEESFSPVIESEDGSQAISLQ